MLREPIDTPQIVAETLRHKSFTLPTRSRSEVFTTADRSLRALVCTAPGMRSGTQSVVISLLDAPEKARRLFVARLQSVIDATRLKIPGIDVINGPAATVLLAPWVYRGEIRAFVASVVASHIEDMSLTTPSCMFSPSLPDAAPTLTLADLKDVLYQFALPFDSVLRHSLRRMTKFTDSSVWAFPLGCTIRESVSAAGVVWEIHFNDVETLERACTLVEARCDSGKMKALILTPHSQSPGHETQFPVIRIVSSHNSQATRIEMAKLLRNLLVLLDRMNFRTPIGR